MPYPHLIQVFLDGGYLRSLARAYQHDLVHPLNFAKLLCANAPQTWAHDPTRHPNALLARVGFYDAMPDAEAAPTGLEDYWRAVELLDDVYLGYGMLRGQGRPRQKAVDTLVAVDMVSGAYSGTFDIAVVVSGDADYIPAVFEVKRRGVMVCVAAARDAGAGVAFSDDLRRSADRFIPLQNNDQWFPPMRGEGGKTWTSAPPTKAQAPAAP